MALLDSKRRVRSIIKAMLIAIVAFIVLLWFLGGGIGLIIGKEQAFNIQLTSFPDFIASIAHSTSSFALPGYEAAPHIVLPSLPSSSGENQPPAESSAYANASPYAGEIAIRPVAARTQSAQGQYIELQSTASQPIDISGWTIESALSGQWAYLPQAAGLFRQGVINAVANVVLPPGGLAIISTGPSPVGVSFRENQCTGYLGTLQPFIPALPQKCPAALLAIPETPENVALYGQSCFEYLSSLPPCTFPDHPPATLSAACTAEIQNTLSYNGCVDQNKTAAFFNANSWRLYLAEGKPLWQGQHDVIRLLDAQGGVVDVINY